MCHFRGTIPAAWDGMMPLLQTFSLHGNQLRRVCCKGEQRHYFQPFSTGIARQRH